MVGCEFETPPESGTVCLQGPLQMIFDSNSENFPKFKIKFYAADNLTVFEGGNYMDCEYDGFYTEGKAVLFVYDKEKSVFTGYFSKEDLSEIKMMYKFDSEGCDFVLRYSVER